MREEKDCNLITFVVNVPNLMSCGLWQVVLQAPRSHDPIRWQSRQAGTRLSWMGLQFHACKLSTFDGYLFQISWAFSVTVQIKGHFAYAQCFPSLRVTTSIQRYHKNSGSSSIEQSQETQSRRSRKAPYLPASSPTVCQSCSDALATCHFWVRSKAVY